MFGISAELHGQALKSHTKISVKERRNFMLVLMIKMSIKEQRNFMLVWMVS
jgi:hypothetical protein